MFKGNSLFFYISTTRPWKYTYIIFLSLDVHRMRDRFIDSVKGKDEQVTTEGGPVRRTSFVRYFCNALLPVNEEEEITSNKELASEEKRMEIVVPSPPKPRAVEDDQMLKEIKELPRESKINVLQSIIYGLMGTDAATVRRLPKMPNDTTETFGGGRPGGVDNRGLDCDEAELRSDPIEEIQTDREMFPSNVSPDSRKTDGSSLSLEVKMNSKKTSVVSGDPEFDLPVTPEPKTVRSWLKDPHLYKVCRFSLWRIA